MGDVVAAGDARGFGLFLRGLRRGRGLSQETLALRSGLSDRAIRDLERGRVRRPRRATVELLVASLELGPDEADRLRAMALAGSGSADAAHDTVPAQLPADIPDFTGRREVLDRVESLLVRGQADGQAVAVVALAGIGGVGKTTVAVRAAHRVRRRFPDGQLYADLQGARHQPMEPAAVLALFLRALGVPEAALPARLDERSTLLRTRLSGRRVLLVLDNARDAAQVRPVLPGSPSCAVLVTARSRLVGLGGATVVDVDCLDRDEGVALLAAIVGRERVEAEPDAAAELVAACAGLPLAVRIAGARLVARPGWRLRTLADRLASRQRRLDELQLDDLAVRAVFQVAYEQLADPAAPEPSGGAARMFRLLGWLDHESVGEAAAGAALGVDADTAGVLLERLVDAQLLIPQGPGRYRFHDLVRLFAREQALREEPPGELSAALARAVRGYLAALQEANRLLRPGRLLPRLPPEGAAGPAPADPEDALAWLEAEHPSILPIAFQALRDPEQPVLPIACLVDHLQTVMEFWGHGESLEELVGLVDAAAVRAGDGYARALAGMDPARTAWSAPPDEAHQRLETSLRLFEELGAHDGVVRALNRLGMLHLDRDPRRAKGYFDRAMRVCLDHGLRRGEGGLLCNQGLAHQRLGEHDRAADCYERALVVQREIGDRDGLANTVNNLGRLRTEQHRYDEAVACHRESLRVGRHGGNRFWEIEALVSLAAAYRGLGLPQAGLMRVERALELSERLGNGHAEGTALNERAHTLFAMGEHARAAADWRRALERLEQAGSEEATAVRAVLARLPAE
ncbi:ATP-binding protein [Allonocardiopsis opalescens]|uniref:Putative ATPase n=1 Tax=Allonocardiopsis opalescens TaxID=1144618 RepID=A0A2T0QA52_9ACTN|nr:tetratricopeptide repeat protein [Allonocardiopsis opalescens]PRY00691.1 putative ATPase [Allonocardiopsis opalescens]